MNNKDLDTQLNSPNLDSNENENLELPSGPLYVAASANPEFKQSLKQQFLQIAGDNAAVPAQAAAIVAEKEQTSQKPQRKAVIEDTYHQKQDSGFAFIFPFLGGVTFGLVLLVAILNSGLLNTDIFLPDNNQPILVNNQQILDQVYANNAPELSTAINGEFDGLGSLVDISATIEESSATSLITTSQTQISNTITTTQTTKSQQTSTISTPAVYTVATTTTIKIPNTTDLTGCTNTKIQNLLHAVKIVEISSPSRPDLGKKILSYDRDGNLLSTEVYVGNKAYIYKSGNTGAVIDLSVPVQTSSSASSTASVSATSISSSNQRQSPQVLIVEQSGKKVYSIETETKLDCAAETADLISKSIVDPVTFKVTKQETYLKQESGDLLLYTAVTETASTTLEAQAVIEQLAKVNVTYVPEQIGNVQGLLGEF